MDVGDSQLRWRCRRGMLELDLLLRGFVNTGYASLEAEQKKVFDRMLDYPDAVLYDVLLGNTRSSDQEVDQLATRIRQSATHSTQAK